MLKRGLPTGIIVCLAATAATPKAPVVSSAWPSAPGTIGLYEKFELRIDLRAEFTAPSGKTQTIWGFYNPSSWASLWIVRIAPNHRYLKHDDGTAFYGVGLWYNDSYEQFNAGQITEASSTSPPARSTRPRGILCPEAARSALTTRVFCGRAT